jgi:hypothetical protein
LLTFLPSIMSCLAAHGQERKNANSVGYKLAMMLRGQAKSRHLLHHTQFDPDCWNLPIHYMSVSICQ